MDDYEQACRLAGQLQRELEYGYGVAQGAAEAALRACGMPEDAWSARAVIWGYYQSCGGADPDQLAPSAGTARICYLAGWYCADSLAAGAL